MRYRPRSSVTTILRNLVGSSVVSAITHTPASGPFALVTTPPMSVGPTETWLASSCGLTAAWAVRSARPIAITAANTPSTTNEDARTRRIFSLTTNLLFCETS